MKLKCGYLVIFVITEGDSEALDPRCFFKLPLRLRDIMKKSLKLRNDLPHTVYTYHSVK